MTPVLVLLNLVALIAEVWALTTIVWSRSGRALRRDLAWIVAGLLVLLMVESGGNLLEWSGLTTVMDPIEESAELVLTLFWGILVYCLLQAQTEEGLAESERRFRALVDATAQMVWTTDAAGNIVDDSPSWRSFTGQTIEEWKGSGWLDVLHPDDRVNTWNIWQRAMETTTPYEACYRVYHSRSGEWKWIVARAVPLRRNDGSVHGWVGMSTDINERKRG